MNTATWRATYWPAHRHQIRTGGCVPGPARAQLALTSSWVGVFPVSIAFPSMVAAAPAVQHEEGLRHQVAAEGGAASTTS
jgi:hypothetical protein